MRGYLPRNSAWGECNPGGGAFVMGGLVFEEFLECMTHGRMDFVFYLQQAVVFACPV